MASAMRGSTPRTTSMAERNAVDSVLGADIRASRVDGGAQARGGRRTPVAARPGPLPDGRSHPNTPVTARPGAYRRPAIGRSTWAAWQDQPDAEPEQGRERPAARRSGRRPGARG